MKTFAALALASGLALSVAAQAEPFNDRGPDFRDSIKTNPEVVRQRVTVNSLGFNDRSEDASVVAPLNADRKPLDYMAITGFNERDQAGLI